MTRINQSPVESTALIPLSLARDRLRSLGQSVIDSKVNQSISLVQMREKYSQAAQLERESFERVLIQMKQRAIDQYKSQVEVINQLKTEIESLKQAQIDQSTNQSINQPINQSINQSTPSTEATTFSEAVSIPVDISDDQPINQPQSTSQSDNQIELVTQSDSISRSEPANQPKSANQSESISPPESIDQSVSTNESSFVNQSISQLSSEIEMLLIQFNISSNDSERINQLTELQSLLLDCQSINRERTNLSLTVSSIKSRQTELQNEKRQLIAIRNQSINQSTNQSTDGTNNESTNQSVSQSINQSEFDRRKAALSNAGTQLRNEHSQLESQLAKFRSREAAIQPVLCKFNIDNQAINQSTDQSTNQSANQSINDQSKRKRRMSPVEETQIERLCAHFLSNNQSINQPKGNQSINQSQLECNDTAVVVDISVNQSVNQLISQLSPISEVPDHINQSINRPSSLSQSPADLPRVVSPALIHQSINQSISQSINQSQITALEQQIHEYTEQLQKANQRIFDLENRPPPVYQPVEPVIQPQPDQSVTQSAVSVVLVNQSINQSTDADQSVKQSAILKAELAAVKSKYAADLEYERALMRRDLTQAKKELEQAQISINQKFEQQKLIDQQLEEQKSINQQLEQQKSINQEQLIQLAATNQSINQSINQSHAKEIAVIRAEAESIKATNTIINQQLVALQKENEKDKSTIESLNQSINQLQVKFDILSAESKQSINQSKIMKSTILTLESELSNAKAKLSDLLLDRASLLTRFTEEQIKRKEFQFKYEDAKGKVRVYARVRPFVKSEIERGESTLLRMGRNDWTLELNETQRDLFNHVSEKWRDFAFDAVFHPGLEGVSGPAKATGDQEIIFDETRTFGELAMQGINACVFAYGQSGTGKTFTMAGTREQPGLKPRMIKYVYELADRSKLTHHYSISCYLIEIYLNRLEDLGWKTDHHRDKSKHEAPELKLRIDSKNKRVQIDNVTMKTFTTAEEMLTYCDEAEKLRRVRKTGLNEASSRSHLVFALCIESTELKSGRTLKGKLSLVDLAGSERADKTNVDGLSKAAREAMMEEGVAINESLRMLKNVFRILGTANQPAVKSAGNGPAKAAEVVQYRGNALTELMQDSLGGNAKTLMFVNVGPAASNISESIDSLSYADLVKNITMEKASADEDLAPVVRKLREQLAQYDQKGSAAAG